MKKSVFLFLVALSALIAVQSSNANVIATWTFETSPPADLNNNTTISGILADVGTGTASGVHASAATDWSTPVGNGSANSLSANTWSVGDYYQFSVSSVSFSGIKISFDQTSSSTGPGTFGLFYSIDGINYSQFGVNYSVLEMGAVPNANWSALTYSSAYSYAFDLSSINALENDSSIFFRLIDRTTTSANGGTVGTSGTDRVDNFSVTGTAISAPDQTSTLALGVIVVFGCFAFGRRAQQLV
jgi:hypothetical protein